MSIFKGFGGSSKSSSIFGGSTSTGSSGGGYTRVTNLIKNEENPNKHLSELEKDLMKKYRKETEELAETIHPTLGKVARTLNNFQDTI